MIICLLYDTDFETIAVYKENECFYSNNLKGYPNLSIDQLLEIGLEKMKTCWRTLL